MSLYAHRTCPVCGRSFTTDCNEYTCSAECEDAAYDEYMERQAEDTSRTTAPGPFTPCGVREPNLQRSNHEH